MCADESSAGLTNDPSTSTKREQSPAARDTLPIKTTKG